MHLCAIFGVASRFVRQQGDNTPAPHHPTTAYSEKLFSQNMQCRKIAKFGTICVQKNRTGSYTG